MRNKIKIWLQRYLTAEIIGTLAAVILPTIVSLFSKNIILIAFIGSWGENIGFYGTMFSREIYLARKKRRSLGKIYTRTDMLINVRNIFLEFGFSEILDSLFIRPVIIYFSIGIIPNLQFALFVGKIAADFVFYIPTIISYELRKKHLGD